MFLAKLQNTRSIISILLITKSFYYNMFVLQELLTGLYVLALQGLKLCSCSVFLFEAEYGKSHGLGREISQEALQTQNRVVLGYSKTIFLPNQVVFLLMLYLGCANRVALFNQCFVVYEKLDGVRVCS